MKSDDVAGYHSEAKAQGAPFSSDLAGFGFNLIRLEEETRRAGDA